MKNVLYSLLLTLLSFQALADSSLHVEAEIYSGEELVGAPTILMRSDAEATVSVDGAYALSLRASLRDDETVLMVVKLSLDDEQHTPAVLLEPGKESRLRMGSTTLTLLVSE